MKGYGTSRVMQILLWITLIIFGKTFFLTPPITQWVEAGIKPESTTHDSP